MDTERNDKRQSNTRTGIDSTSPSLALPPGFRLPVDFAFGVCNSPYHSEGGINTPDGFKNNWANWELSGYAETSGETNRFWDHPEPHIAKSREIGFTTFRMGFDWARMQPSASREETAEPPVWDEEALDRYAEIVGMVYDAGMEPCITLHHFVHPMWVGYDLWTRDDKVALFDGFARRAVREVNRRLVNAGHPAIRWYVTFNEPFNACAGSYLFGDMPPGGRKDDVAAYGMALNNMLASHVRTYDAIYDIYEEEGWREPFAAFNFVSYAIYELDKLMTDIVQAPVRGINREDVPGYLSERRQLFDDHFNSLAAERLTPAEKESWIGVRRHYRELYDQFDFDVLLDALDASPRKKKLDYVGVDCYDPFIIATFGINDSADDDGGSEPAAPEGSAGSGDDTREGFDWTKLHFDAEVCRRHLEAHGRDLEDGVPLIIQETTLGHLQSKGGEAAGRPDGLYRPQFLREILQVCVDLVSAGVDLRGFFYWTLCDNYEWGTHTSRLGLLEYDYANHRILDADAFGDRNGEILQAQILAMRGLPGD